MSKAKATSQQGSKTKKTAGKTARRTIAIKNLASKHDKDVSRKDPSTGATYATRKKP
jgi:hypothetical protein